MVVTPPAATSVAGLHGRKPNARITRLNHGAGGAHLTLTERSLVAAPRQELQRREFHSRRVVHAKARLRQMLNARRIGDATQFRLYRVKRLLLRRDLPVHSGQFRPRDPRLLRDVIERETGKRRNGEAEKGGNADHGCSPQAARAVRSAARRRAERARGLRAISSDVATRGRDQTGRNVCFCETRRSGACRETGCGLLRSTRNLFTMRSSSEWNATTASRPPVLSTRSAATRPRSSSPSSSFTCMRNAWKVRVAG